MSISPQKRCPRCGESKPLDGFYIDRSKASGRRSICKSCDLGRSRTYYRANRERVIARVRARAQKVLEERR
jgi:hypothetical protein